MMEQGKNKTAKTLNIRFYECEHGGDLARYEEDLTKSGASIIDSGFSDDEEEGWARITIEDLDAFRSTFTKTEAFDFSNLADFWR